MTIDPGAARAILDAVAAREADAERMLARLVAHPSTLGNEASCLDEMAAIYGEIGLAPRRVPTDPAALASHPGFSPPLISYEGRDNVVAVHTPKEKRGRSLMLQGHIDVVPEGAADLWASPPYQARIANGRMYGRGAGDMKAGVVSYLMAYQAIRDAGLSPAAEVQMAAVIEEECTGNGALAVMQALPKPDAAIIPEPGPEHIALYTAEVGVVWAWVTVTGRPTHVREMHAGVNAIEAANIIAARFKEYEAKANAAELIHPAFHGNNHPVNVNFGTVEGGEWNSSVPTRARIGMRVGLMIGNPARKVAAEIEALVADAATDPKLRGAKVKVEFKGFMADGCTFPVDSPLHQAVIRHHDGIVGGAPRTYAASGLTDGRFYELYQSTPCCVYGPDAADIHGIDESVGLASMHQVTRVLALTIAEWCGLERA